MGQVKSKRTIVTKEFFPSFENPPYLTRQNQPITTTQQMILTPRKGTDPCMAEPHLQKKSLISQGDYNWEVIHDPHNGRLLNKLGKSLYSSGQSKEALCHLRKAAVLKQCDYEGYSILAQIYQKEKKISEAIDCLLGALDLEPSSFQVLSHLAFLYTNLSNFQRGLIYGVAALKNGRSAQLFNTLGRCYYGKANGDSATLDFAQNNYINAIEENPTFVQAYNNLGNVYRAKGDFKNAIAMYEDVIQKTRHSKSREFYIAHLNLGATLIERNRLIEGMKHIHSAQSKQFPQIEDILRRSGIILLFQHPGIQRALQSLMSNESVLALEQLHECYSSCHLNPFHHFLRAKAYEDLGFMNHAQKYYQNVIRQETITHSISLQEKKLKQAQFCNKIIKEAEKCLDRFRQVSTSQEGEAALQLMQEETHTPRRLSLANYASKTKKMDTIEKQRGEGQYEALHRHVLATLPTDQTLDPRNSNYHKRSSSDDIRLYMLKYASPQRAQKRQEERAKKLAQPNNSDHQEKNQMLKREEQEKEEEDTKLQNSMSWLKAKGVGAELTQPQSAVFGLILQEDYDF